MSDGAIADAATFREAMRRFATGVTVVTTIVDGEPHGFTATAFTSVSADPPSVLVCVNRAGRSHALIATAGIFAVNVLTSAQRSVAERFAQGRDEQLDGIAWHREGGAPLLDGAIATFDCTVAEELSVATHTIFVGTVVAAKAGTGVPLGYFGGTFHDLEIV